MAGFTDAMAIDGKAVIRKMERAYGKAEQSIWSSVILKSHQLCREVSLH